MRRIYLRAGLYAEGAADYAFLGRLLPRVLTDLTASAFPGACDVEPILRSCDSRLRPRATFELLGERVRLAKLRALAAFQAFEAELTQVVRAFVADQGYRSA